MPIETVKFRDAQYPIFQTDGNAARFVMPFAKEIVKGAVIFDIGYGREEWKFPGAIGIDRNSNDERLQDAMNLPFECDGIFSSHCLEHLNDWVGHLDYWTTKLKSSGTIFLYLPHWEQKYHRPYSNRKHVNAFLPEMIQDYFVASGKYKNIFVSCGDAYNSFTAFAERL